MASNHPKETEEHRSGHNTGSPDHKQPRVIVWDPLNHQLSFEMQDTLDSKSTTSPDGSPLTKTEDDASFKVHLPRWRNRVDIYLDEEHKAGFVTSIDLSKLGVGKNLKRRLRYSYTVLHVKGANPRMPSKPNSDLTTSTRNM